MNVHEWTIGQLEVYVEGLSRPSKMPGYAYSLPAQECRTGSKLHAQVGTVCSECYALKGRYRFPKVQAALYRRLEAISKPLWPDAMGELINRRAVKHPHFRWHDSGDLQSVGHLADIARVCELSPTVKHWMPTREYRTVADYVTAGGLIPPNLNVRMSANKIGGHVPTFARLPVTVSTVTPAGSKPPPGARRCPPSNQGNQCLTCRACWNRDIAIVDYPLH